jgi:hypothetical protein
VNKFIVRKDHKSALKKFEQFLRTGEMKKNVEEKKEPIPSPPPSPKLPPRDPTLFLELEKLISKSLEKAYNNRELWAEYPLKDLSINIVLLFFESSNITLSQMKTTGKASKNGEYCTNIAPMIFGRWKDFLKTTTNIIPKSTQFTSNKNEEEKPETDYLSSPKKIADVISKYLKQFVDDDEISFEISTSENGFINFSRKGVSVDSTPVNSAKPEKKKREKKKISESPLENSKMESENSTKISEGKQEESTEDNNYNNNNSKKMKISPNQKEEKKNYVHEFFSELSHRLESGIKSKFRLQVIFYLFIYLFFKKKDFPGKIHFQTR